MGELVQLVLDHYLGNMHIPPRPLVQRLLRAPPRMKQIVSENADR